MTKLYDSSGSGCVVKFTENDALYVTSLR